MNYFAPTFWAWRSLRAKKIQAFLDGLICLFDFETPYFEFPTVAAGHPMVEGEVLKADGTAFREHNGIPASETVIGLLFGSRKGELKRTGKILRDAAFNVADRMASLPQIVAPTLPHLRKDVHEILKDYRGEVHIIAEPDQKWNALRAMDVALACSGTVGLELAMLQIPHLIAYRMNPMTFHVLKHLVKVKYAHLANIMADREIVPEFIQGDCKVPDIANTAFNLLMSPDQQREQFAGIAHRLGAGQKETPSQKAAAFVLDIAK